MRNGSVDGATRHLRQPRDGFDYVEVDLFAWQPERTYDVCFFSFWLSDVPKEHWQSFWEKIERALAPGGRACLVDNARSDRASARDHDLQGPEEEAMLRRLADGREYHIVKHWFDAAGLGSGLAGVGWNALIRSTPEFFVYGEATPTG